MRFKLRKNVFPKVVRDITASSFLFLVIPLVYWFEIFVVLEDHFGDCPNSYRFNFIFGTFLLINVVGNLVAAVLVDSSIRGEVMPSTLKPSWRFCDVCECVVPPRSWHCFICDICILKRDHHCNFTGCCIGHYNQRYFIMFLFYMMTSTAYATYFNVLYLWKTMSIFNIVNMMKLFFPLAAFVTGIDYSVEQYYRIICILTVVGFIASSSLFIYHIENVFKGRVMYERMKQIPKYDARSIKSNIKLVFGERWHLALFTPFVKSDLPHDGIHWDEADGDISKRNE